MLPDIINSRVKTQILKVFSMKRDSLHVSEVARLAKVSKSRASECLRELAENGVLESNIAGRNLVYSLSSTEFAETVINIFLEDRNFLNKIHESLVNEIKNIKPVSVVLFGSALNGLKPGSDIDFFVITKGKNEFYHISSKLTEKFGFTISVLDMSEDEFRQKAKKGEEFILNVMANHKLLYGKNLEEVVWLEKSEKKKQQIYEKGRSPGPS